MTPNPSSDGGLTPQPAEVGDLSAGPPPCDGVHAVVALLHQAARVAELGQVDAALAGARAAVEAIERLIRAGRGGSR